MSKFIFMYTLWSFFWLMYAIFVSHSTVSIVIQGVCFCIGLSITLYRLHKYDTNPHLTNKEKI